MQKLTVESDYERWSPADMLEDAHPTTRRVCFQGVRTFFIRRKGDRKCRSTGGEFGKTERPCECMREDFQCSVGYMRDHEGMNSNCIAVDPWTASSVCAKHWSFSVSIPAPYSKIPGNICEGGLEFRPTQEVCHQNVVVFVVVACVACIFFSRAWKSEWKPVKSRKLSIDEELRLLLD